TLSLVSNNKDLFAPVVKPTTLRTLPAGATIKGWVVKRMDVTTAFLNGILEEEIFMAQPEGFDDGSGRVWKLKKVLYGLKKAPRQWYLKLREVLAEIGFFPSSADHSLFMLGEGEQRSFMVVYVDEILIFSPSSDLVKEVMLKLQDKFKCKALGDVSFYLGLHIERDVEKRCMRGPEDESVGEEERRRFHSLVGSLMYAAVNTRPDVAFATKQLARVVQCPNEEQVAARMRVAKYLGQTATVGLQYSSAAQRHQKGSDGVEPGRLFLTAFLDASYASKPEDMTSVGGFICCVGGGPTAWESKKQVDQALSSVESEYMALFRAVREIAWQWLLLAELGEEQQGPTPPYCDSQCAIALAKNPALHGLTKHDRHTHFVWVMPATKKSDVLWVFEKWLLLVERQTNKSVLMLRSDRGSEFLGKEFANFVDGKGIVHDLTCPYTPQQNGMAEREMRTVVESVRTMLLHMGVQHCWWHLALRHAVWVCNCLERSTTPPGTTPYQLLTCKKPDLTLARVWGCMVQFMVPE
ncbi:unnamed protein product, partial [Closterium sp. NIES-53]